MKDKLRCIYLNSSLTTKIRYSYLIFLIPIILFLIFCFYNLWSGNRNYEDMINSVSVASEFSMDFKKDFDYETYLLVVGNKQPSESKLNDMLGEALRIVTGLEELTDSSENLNRLASAKKYIHNLEIYKGRIEQNLIDGNKYVENIEIWENDIQIVTSLLRETITQYIYYEIRELQVAREQYQDFFMGMISFSVIAFAVISIILVFCHIMCLLVLPDLFEN